MKFIKGWFYIFNIPKHEYLRSLYKDKKRHRKLAKSTYLKGQLCMKEMAHYVLNNS